MVEKQKKLKPGAPRDPIPAVDNIEQAENGSWSLLENWHFRHLNLCMNPIDSSHREEIMALMERTPDEFSITLSGTMFEENEIHEMSEQLGTDENPNLGAERIIF